MPPRAHEQLLHALDLAREAINEIPAEPRPDSFREHERRAVLSDQRYGPGRVALLDELNIDGQIGAANVAFVVGGVADALQAASLRDNQVNVPAVSIVTRAAVESSGQLAWLLDDSIEGSERARRFLTWRFADLRTQRLLVGDFRPSNTEATAAVAELDGEEGELCIAAELAGWESKSTVMRRGHLEAAALLGADGKNERMPKMGELALMVSSSPSVYALLSVSAHGSRFGQRHNMELEEASADSQQVRIGGFGVPPNMAIGLCLVAIDRSCGSLARWNGIDTQRLHSATDAIMRAAGLL